MLLGTLVSSLLGNLWTDNGRIRAEKDTVRSGQNF